jgi:hypothetical protein
MALRKRPLKRLLAALLTITGMVMVAGLAAATSSAASPYSDGPTVSVSTTTPAVGGSVTVAGSGFGAHDMMTIVLHTKAYDLGTTRTDAAGAFSAAVGLPDGVSGHHTIVVTDAATGRTQSISIEIGGAAGRSSESGGGLSSTGVAVIGLGALAVVLLVGGGLAMFAGRKSKVVS